MIPSLGNSLPFDFQSLALASAQSMLAAPAQSPAQIPPIPPDGMFGESQANLSSTMSVLRFGQPHVVPSL